MRRAAFGDQLRQDVHYAFRSLRRRPGFTAVALLTLALGIGVNTAIFSVVHAALLRPLPYHEPHRLVHLWETDGRGGDDRSEASWPDFLDWRSVDAFAALEGYDPTNIAVTGGEAPLMLRGARVTAGFLSMLGATPVLGRSLRPEDEQPGGAPVVVISHALWRRDLGAGTDVLGRSITINGHPHTVVGVLPPTFHFAPLQDADVWLPLDAAAVRAADRSNHWVNVVGRLRAGVDQGTAHAQLATVMQRIADEHVASHERRGIAVESLRTTIVGAARPVLLVLLGAAGLVLAIACVNVAALFLARATERTRELALRSALGASRGRLRRQLVTEGVLLSATGAAIGVGCAIVGARALVAAVPVEARVSMPYLETVELNATVLIVTSAIAAITGIAFGLLPSGILARSQPARSLRGGGRGTTGRSSLRGGLVVAQLALTILLLVGAGLMARSLIALLSADVGFAAERILTARVALQGEVYAEPHRQQEFFTSVLQRVDAIPGVSEAGAVTKLPLEGGGSTAVQVVGRAVASDRAAPEAILRGVAGGYFRAMGIPLVAGRTFDDRQGEPARQLVVSEALARRLNADGTAVGERLRVEELGDAEWEIIGVVADVRTERLDDPPPPTLYYTHDDVAENRLTLVLRIADERLSPGVVGAIRGAVRELDPLVPVYAVATMEETMDRSPEVLARRYPLQLVGAFAGTALLLAIIGVYGVVAYSVLRRRRELAVRLALGASPREVLRLVLREGAALAAAGLAFGIVVAVWLARYLRELLYEVGTLDPLTYVVVASVLAASVMIASWIPARRAARIDPAGALRADE